MTDFASDAGRKWHAANCPKRFDLGYQGASFCRGDGKHGGTNERWNYGPDDEFVGRSCEEVFALVEGRDLSGTMGEPVAPLVLCLTCGVESPGHGASCPRYAILRDTPTEGLGERLPIILEVAASSHRAFRSRSNTVRGFLNRKDLPERVELYLCAIRELSGRNLAALRHIDEVRVDVAAARRERDEALARVAELTAHLEARTAERDDALGDVKVLKDYESVLNERVAELEKKIKEDRVGHVNVRYYTNEVIKTNERLIVEVAELEAQRDQAVTIVRRIIDSELCGLVDGAQVVESNVKFLRGELDRIRKKDVASEETVDALKAEVEKLKGEKVVSFDQWLQVTSSPYFSKELGSCPHRQRAKRCGRDWESGRSCREQWRHETGQDAPGT